MRKFRPELKRTGTTAGDLLAQSRMIQDMTNKEPTHELQEWFECGIEPGWDTIDAGPEGQMNAQLEKGKQKRRVIERVLK